MTEYLFLQGPPGSGKTTLAKSLQKKLGWAHLDRDNYVGDRAQAYREMKRDLLSLAEKEQGAIIDAPFLFENDYQFQEWIEPLPSHLLVYMHLSPGERVRRRRRRNLLRDQVSSWSDLVLFEERWYRPRPGSLRLDGASKISVLEDILAWHMQIDNRIIRKAGKDDLLAVREFKDEILRGSFSRFLNQEELKSERKQVASSLAVKRLLEEDEVFLALRDGEIWGMLAAASVENNEQLIFSGYSRGDRAVSALGAFLISRALDEGLSALRAVVYRENKISKKVLASFGFQDSGKSHTNPLVPRVEVEHWKMSLLGRK